MNVGIYADKLSASAEYRKLFANNGLSIIAAVTDLKAKKVGRLKMGDNGSGAPGAKGNCLSAY